MQGGASTFCSVIYSWFSSTCALFRSQDLTRIFVHLEKLHILRSFFSMLPYTLHTLLGEGSFFLKDGFKTMGLISLLVLKDHKQIGLSSYFSTGSLYDSVEEETELTR